MRALIILSLLLTTGCTGQTAEVDLKPLPVIPEHAATLDVFASYSCAICTHELPALQKRITEFNETHAKKVLVRLWLTGGKNGKPADIIQAKNYCDALGLSFEPHVDNRCRGKYQEYYPNEGCYVPGHAIVSRGGEKIIYPQGAVNLDELIRDLVEVTNQ